MLNKAVILLKNEKGMTLVELLAAIVILTLVITVFLQFLPQLAKTNKINIDKNQAINIAENELNYWESILTNANNIKDTLEEKNENKVLIELKKITDIDWIKKECKVIKLIDDTELPIDITCYITNEKINLQYESYNDKFYVSIKLLGESEEEFDSYHTKAYRLHLEIKSRENDAKIGEAFGFVYF